jgi:hypothetical protein
LTSAAPIQANTEAQKKAFFDLAVRNKNQLGYDHPAQSVMIADLYQRCNIEKVPENQWNEWIKSIYS